MNVHPHLYPVAVIQDRYNGTYSGGTWLAIANAREPYDDAATRATWCLRNGPHGGDTEAIKFWADPPSWIKAGNSPAEAIAKLVPP